MNADLIGERGRLLDPIDRVSEIIFGLIMAVTIVGTLSIATAGKNEVRTVMLAALGCNLAWGLVDAVMYLVRTLTERTRIVALAEQMIGAPDADTAHRFIRAALPPHVDAITGSTELEGMRGRLLDLPRLRQGLKGRDYLAATGIFLLVVAATFPVVLPFLLTSDTALAMNISRGITLALLFAAGFKLSRYAGHERPVRMGLAMLLLGAALIAAVIALGG